MNELFSKKSVRLASKIAATAFTVLFGFMATATVIAKENEKEVNNFFGEQSTSTGGTTSVEDDLYKSDYNSVREVKDNALKVSEDIEAEGAVLLKNDNNALPLAANSKVSLFSYSSVDPRYGGGGSGDPAKSENFKPITFKAGLEQASLSVNATLWNFYTSNSGQYKRNTNAGKLNDAPWSDIIANSEVNSSITTYGDAAILNIAREGGEGNDMKPTGYEDALEGNYLKLGINEDTVLKGLKALKDQGKIKKIIVILNLANAFETEFLYDSAYGVDAALWVGTVGDRGFKAVGDILAGKVNPSGKLADTYYYDHSDNPVMANFGEYHYSNFSAYENIAPGSTKAQDERYLSYMVYQEGIYVGYRYTETRYEDVVMGTANAGTFNYGEVVSHPFGSGLSYTEFEYSDYSVEKDGDSYNVSVTVTNTGDVAGKEAVQIYLQKPYTQYDIDNGIEKSAVDLVGYEKTKLLEPDESETLTITVDGREFASYDANGAKTYIVDAGDYYLTAAANAHDAINNILAAKGYDTDDGMDVAGNEALTESFNVATLDTTTYATSRGTGETVTNLFDFADINKYENRGSNSVTYLSRNNWTGTFPTGAAVLNMNDAMMNDILAQDDITTIKTDNVEYPTYGDDTQPAETKLIQMYVDEDGNEIPYDDERWDAFMDQLSWNEIVALVSDGYHLTAANVRVVKPETYDYNGPCGLTVKAYNYKKSGLAARTNDPDGSKEKPVAYPGAGVLASTFSKEIALAYGKSLGEEALWVGYNGFYGIGLNTHRSPYAGRTYEYYSEDSYLAGMTAALEVIGLQDHGCSAYIKHFALNDQEAQRHGISVWLNEQSLREIYLKGFEMSVAYGNADNAMAAFNRIGVKFAAGCSELLTDFLRTEAGMTGFVVSDMWAQQLYKDNHLPLFILAGLDIPDGTINNPSNLFDQFKTGYGELAWAMRESAKRILYNTVHSSAMNGITVDSTITMVMPNWLKLAIALDVIFGVLCVASFVCAGLCYVSWFKGKKVEE